MRDDPKSRQDSARMELAKFHKIVFRVPEVVTRLPQIGVVRRYFAHRVYTRSQNHRLICASDQRVHSVRARGKDYEYSPLGKKNCGIAIFWCLIKRLTSTALNAKLWEDLL